MSIVIDKFKKDFNKYNGNLHSPPQSKAPPPLLEETIVLNLVLTFYSYLSTHYVSDRARFTWVSKPDEVPALTELTAELGENQPLSYTPSVSSSL